MNSAGVQYEKENSKRATRRKLPRLEMQRRGAEHGRRLKRRQRKQRSIQFAESGPVLILPLQASIVFFRSGNFRSRFLSGYQPVCGCAPRAECAACIVSQTTHLDLNTIKRLFVGFLGWYNLPVGDPQRIPPRRLSLTYHCTS